MCVTPPRIVFALPISVCDIAPLPPLQAAAAADAEGTPAGDEGDEGHKEKAASPEPIDEAAQEQATDDLALTIIMGVVSNRPAPPATGEAAAAAAEKKEEGRRSSHRGVWCGGGCRVGFTV